MSNLIVLGQIIKSRGLKGELKIKPFSQDLKQFMSFREVYIGTTLFAVLEASVSAPFVYLKLDGIDSLEKAESFKNKEIFIDKQYIKPPSEDEYFVSDLIGCSFKSGEYEGIVSDVYQYGAADVLEIKLNSGGKLMFPHLLKLGLKVDIENKTIEVDVDKLASVAVINQ